MRYTVKDTFWTPLHRFELGQEIDEADIDGPVPVAGWVELGRIQAIDDQGVSEAPAAVEPQPEKAEAVHELEPPVEAEHS